MGTKFEVNNDGILYLGSQSSDPSSPTEGQIWYNSTVNKIKYYDGTDVITTTGYYGTPWYFDSDKYTVYDNFNSYSTGTFSSNTKWTASSNNYIVASTNAGGDTKEVEMRSVDTTNKLVTLKAIDLTANKSTWFRYWLSHTYVGQGTGGTPRAYVTIDGGTNYYEIYQGGMGQNANVSFANEILVVALGSGVYDVYSGGKKVISSNTPSTFELGIKIQGVDRTSVDEYVRIYIDDVRQQI